MNLSALSDQELMTSLQTVCADSRRLLVALLVHLNEVEERRLELKAAFPSMYEFCIRRLGMSDGEACRRIGAARLIRRFPTLLPRIESGALNLTTLYLLRDHFTEANVEQLADAASGKTKRGVEELVARVAPRPDVPTRIIPTSEGRYEIRFSASAALRAKIERARGLLRHRHPDGNLEAVMNRAFDALLSQLEKERMAATSRPQEKERPADPEHVRAEVRRQVFERDGEQCSYVADDGTRCNATENLELDHIDARARGGPPTVDNLRVFCRAHNRWHAEQDFGQAFIASKIEERRESADPRQRGWSPGVDDVGLMSGAGGASAPAS